MYGEIMICAHCRETGGDHLADCPVVVPAERIAASAVNCHHGIPVHLICGACDAETKATNPKDAIASDKAPLHLVPASFKAYTAVALAEGMMKYGAWNWRAAGVRASVYVSALQRHLDKWFNGEDFDPATGVPHLANASACLAVLIDSMTQGNMADDRPPAQPDFPYLLNTYVPERLGQLREQFSDCKPIHWTINGGEQA